MLPPSHKSVSNQSSRKQLVVHFNRLKSYFPPFNKDVFGGSQVPAQSQNDLVDNSVENLEQSSNAESEQSSNAESEQSSNAESDVPSPTVYLQWTQYPLSQNIILHLVDPAGHDSLQTDTEQWSVILTVALRILTVLDARTHHARRGSSVTYTDNGHCTPVSATCLYVCLHCCTLPVWPVCPCFDRCIPDSVFCAYINLCCVLLMVDYYLNWAMYNVRHCEFQVVGRCALHYYGMRGGAV